MRCCVRLWNPALLVYCANAVVRCVRQLLGTRPCFVVRCHQPGGKRNIDDNIQFAYEMTTGGLTAAVSGVHGQRHRVGQGHSAGRTECHNLLQRFCIKDNVTIDARGVYRINKHKFL